jgi:tRNA-specific 2-thiouridylase
MYSHIPKSATIAVGLSGGVDSSLTAYLLREAGYNVIGLTMRIWDNTVELEETKKHACYGPGEEEDIEIAQRLCSELDIPFHVLDLRQEYKENVLEYFRSEYLRGRTPNPCVVCNHRLKFGFLLENARLQNIEFDYFATGHYAQILDGPEGKEIHSAADESKDQTYFLNSIKKKLLDEVLFPLGQFSKQEVRKMARERGIETADRAESQDFIDGGDYSQLFKDGEITPGEIVDTEGNVLGTHRGLPFYTVGQRKGLGNLSQNHTPPKPWYVLKVDSRKNQIVVSSQQDLFSIGLKADQLNWLAPEFKELKSGLDAKVRVSKNLYPVQITVQNEDSIEVLFEQPIRAVTPGQYLVLYKDTRMVAGAVISSSIPVTDKSGSQFHQEAVLAE